MPHKLSIYTSFLLAASSLQLAATEDLSTSAQTFQSFTGSVIGEKVRLRTQPALDSFVVKETGGGDLFAVLGEQEGYYKVAPPKGTKGYLFRTFVLDGAVEGERVNIRLYPDTEAPIIGRLNTGDKVKTTVCESNSKWLEMELPANCYFYIAKDYVEKKGPVELIASLEKKQHEANHFLASTFLSAQAEIQKPFAQIDLEAIRHKFAQVKEKFGDFPELVKRAQEADSILQEIYIQKKIAFLESKADQSPTHFKMDPSHIERLAALGMTIQSIHTNQDMSLIGEAASQTVGFASTLATDEMTDKMLLWQPLEEAAYHLWVASHGESSLDEFYQKEFENATVLTGIVESYSRPVKNRPGDFLLRDENLPVAFLYSTKVNLQNWVGKKITLIAAPRPNNNFAFPAYFVLSAE